LDWTEQFEAWALKEHGVDITKMFEQDNNKLSRAWKVWSADNKDVDFASEKDAHDAFFADQDKIRAKYAKKYKKINPYPKMLRIENRPDNSVIKQCYVALCDTIRDLMRPVYVRDSIINITGDVSRMQHDERGIYAVDIATTSGYGVGNKLDK